MRKRMDGFGYVALWQLIEFFALILIIWVDELWDLAAIFYGTAARVPSPFNACVLTAGVLLMAIITIGNTYVQQKQIIRGLLTVCSYCHKIRIDKEMWEGLDDYVAAHSLAAMSHGVCPECFDRVKADVHKGGSDQ